MYQTAPYQRLKLTDTRQFYKLSKAHHPDLHPNNPDAAERFVLISEAHATLGSPEKRHRYDRDFLPSTRSTPTAGTPAGSYSSSAAQHAGSRPPSGLSRRRTQFRGPPPSFYRSGGWGNQGEKRGEAHGNPSHAHEAQGQQAQQQHRQQQQQDFAAGPAGTGPGGFTSGFANDVGHFDHEGHLRTHSSIERTRHKARRRPAARIRIDEAGESDYRGSSAVVNFFVISGVLVLVVGVSGVVVGGGAG
ncbi:hypothetical protein LTR62_005579 [Meristemomyces frigidus]|uniref:J domain-containing protein n=1 Tax=Meristemomyces frigidus TaxID=1508187 RepID=A0AAN7TF60_9PEZI|nr:hypothetical protein LTR62_005579 [Meristemomyces frigidus]